MEENKNKPYDNKPKLNRVSLEELEQQNPGMSLEEIDTLKDIELPIRVEFARVQKSIKEVLHLAEGNIVKLNKFAGELVDVFVDERLFARGEISVIDDKFGVRIVEILPPEERLG